MCSEEENALHKNIIARDIVVLAKTQQFILLLQTYTDTLDLPLLWGR